MIEIDRSAVASDKSKIYMFSEVNGGMKVTVYHCVQGR